MITFPYMPGKIVVGGANGRNGFATVCELSKLERVTELIGLFRRPEEEIRLRKLWRAHEERHRGHIHVTPVWTTEPQKYARDANIWIDFTGVSLEALKRKYQNLEAMAIERDVHQRDLLLEENLKISTANTKLALELSPNCIRIQQGNPVDILVRTSVKLGFAPGRVISTGNMLEADRFINIFNQKYPGIALENTCSLYMGEHGELAAAIKSRMSFDGMTPEECLRAIGEENPERVLDEIYREVNTEAFELRAGTGETPWEGPAAVTAELAAMILNPQRNRPVSLCTYVKHNAHYGLDDIALSVPALVGCDGVSAVAEIDLPLYDLAAFRRSVVHIEEMNRVADRMLAEIN